MRKLLSIDPAVLQRLNSLTRNEKTECLLALCELPDAFGHPHAHSGLGIRKLGDKIFECRASIALRFIFQVREVDLYVSFLGNHDEVRALLRTGKYR